MMRGPARTMRPRIIGRKKNRIPLIVFFCLLAAGVGYYFRDTLRFGQPVRATRVRIVDADDFRQVVLNELYKLGIREEWVSRSGDKDGDAVLVRVPRDVSLTMCNLRLHQLMDLVGGKVHVAEESGWNDRIVVKLGCREGVTYTVALKRDHTLARGRVRLALVISGVAGQSRRLLDDLFGLGSDLTVGIRAEGDAAANADRARNAGYEVVLDVPLSGGNGTDADEDRALRPGLSSAEVASLIDGGLADVPGARGIAVTPRNGTDGATGVIKQVLTAIRKKNLYFMDTCPAAGGGDLARKLDIPACPGMQHTPDMNVADHLEHLSRTAMQTGSAVGVSPLSRETVRTFKTYLPRFEKRGIELVYASELVN